MEPKLSPKTSDILNKEKNVFEEFMAKVSVITGKFGEESRGLKPSVNFNFDSIMKEDGKSTARRNHKSKVSLHSIESEPSVESKMENSRVTAMQTSADRRNKAFNLTQPSQTMIVDDG